MIKGCWWVQTQPLEDSSIGSSSPSSLVVRWCAAAVSNTWTFIRFLVGSWRIKPIKSNGAICREALREISKERGQVAM